MLFGHTGAVTALAMANNTVDNTFIVSSADNGYRLLFAKTVACFNAMHMLCYFGVIKEIQSVKVSN